MKIRKIVSLLGILVLSGSVFATTSSVIKLDGFQVLPNQISELSFKKLLDGVSYDVTCNISSNGISKQDWDDIQIIDSHDLDVQVDNINLKGSTYKQTEISTKETGFITVRTVMNGNSIKIRNLDDTDTITISNCFGQPTHFN
ncbi:MAG: hypothetical protein A3E82_03255 [Gammaproteobacteria bacterium RIFCSPHIGHO2_12_FULL_38_11]|nr:MAG: hypothetical protein A3E82_03255 [Gammaproteobacteria bacterium RIFCSPHIGHO2_12_FULL_38_11]